MSDSLQKAAEILELIESYITLETIDPVDKENIQYNISEIIDGDENE